MDGESPGDELAVGEERELLTSRYGFTLDRFQQDALDALDDGKSVLVAAPTGSGKTVVAEYAVARALDRGQRAFYTTPIKALSNQKFHDLVRVHGADRVGLLTGDNAINPSASVVVMTTEVLRNMIYGRSASLDHLGIVVLDEVHFLQDTYRGPVWEEVIVHLPTKVTLVCLSATVSNAEELAAWMTDVRGPTTAVIETKRPVTLHPLYLIGDKTSERLHLLPVLIDGHPNSEAARIDGEAVRGWQAGGRTHGKRKLYTPKRLDVIERLDEEQMLPAIYFIFSRNACDEAMQTISAAGLRLTTAPERDRIRAIAAEMLGSMDDRDLAVLGYAKFLAALENGIASHHAGMVPLFKEVVEECFVEGLVKVVFATETLAVGINMPARTVVIEKLSKFTGEHHAQLTPGEYTQLTGRAGRRGIDDVGHAVVLWSSFVPFDDVASLAASRSFHLQSAFRPTYNMTANLVRAYTREKAVDLLNRSFAQYQADREVVKIHARLERRREGLESARHQATSPFGDIDDYRRQTSRRDRRGGRAVNPIVIEHAVQRLRPGDIILYQRGRISGRAAVLSVASRKNTGARIRAITTTGSQMLMSAQDFSAAPRPVGAIELPTPYEPNRQSYQKDVAKRLERAKTSGAAYADDDEPDEPRHPVQNDPDLHERLRAAAAADRMEREVIELEGKVAARESGLVRSFEHVVEILTGWGYLDGWSLTNSGQRLARLFHEADLLVVEALSRGLLDGLDASTMAGMVSVFTYEHRSSETPPAPWFPSREAALRWRSIDKLATELIDREQKLGLNPTRRPDPTFIAIAYAWAAGESFAQVVEEEQLSGGDFVRNIKQLIDLLRQISDLAANEATRRSAAQATERLLRGVIAASSTVEANTVEVVPEVMR
jgi:ATP-dependent RNA helicase HelY